MPRKKAVSDLPKVLYATIDKDGRVQSDEAILNVVDLEGDRCTYGIYELKRIATGRIVVEVKDEEPVTGA